MKKPKRTYRWLMWCSAAGLAFTLAAAVYSEFRALSWRENTHGVANRFLLYRSSVSVTYRPGPDKVMLTGIEFFQPGWSIARFVPRDSYWGQRWTPLYRHENGSIGEYWFVVLPLWIPAVLLGAGVWWGRKLGGWRGEGFCRACGYDVRGVVGGVCPECGKPTSMPAGVCNNRPE